MRRDRQPGEPVAALVARCATLLHGGVSPPRALQLLAEQSGQPAVLQLSGCAASGGLAIDAMTVGDRPEWRVVAAAWRLAERSGAPLAPALERMAGALQQLDRLREHREVLLSGPRATVRVLAALPVLALGLAALLGFDPLPVLLSPVGMLSVLVGLGLLASGVLWARSMSRTVESGDRVAGIEFELAWVALSGGADPGAALVSVADCVDEARAEWVGFDGFLAGAPLLAAIAAAADTGAPIRPLLLEEADAARLRAHARLEREAERLGVRVLIPLGACVLPSFVAIGVLPVLLSMLGTV